MRRVLRAAMVALLALGALGEAGCSKKRDDGTTPVDDSKGLPALVITDDTPDLMLTWLDDKGGAHVELKPSDVPAASRKLVRVLVADKSEGTGELFYVVDLDKKEADGYHAISMRRGAWEAEIERRRGPIAAERPAAPPPGNAGTAGPAPAPGKQDTGGVTVIIYGASWCHPCHQAEAYLKSKGVRVVMKDIEETPGAQREMRDKLQSIGQRGGSIPVIDVGGQILVGFSEGALDRALAHAGANPPKGTLL